jgi:hypothetical protein
MSSLINTFIPSEVYNTLPTILEVDEIASSHTDDLKDLRALLTKHDVPHSLISIRLIHKHFDTKDGEVMVFFDNVPVPGYGFAQIMKPVKLQEDSRSQLESIHYLVDENGRFQAYEYLACNAEAKDNSAEDLQRFEPFLKDFCDLVSERGLQRIYGLKIKRSAHPSSADVVQREEAELTNWTEFEFPSQRGTIMFPTGMPMPSLEGSSIQTEWQNILLSSDPRATSSATCGHGQCYRSGHGGGGGSSSCSHCRRHCSSHCKNHCSSHCRSHRGKADGDLDEAEHDGLCIGGQHLVPGTAVFEVVGQIVAAF